LGGRKGIPACKKMGGWWRWALVSPDGVVPSWMVGVSASDNLPLHYKVQKCSSGTSSPGWSQKKGCKTVVVWCCGTNHVEYLLSAVQLNMERKKQTNKQRKKERKKDKSHTNACQQRRGQAVKRSRQKVGWFVRV